MVRCGSAGMHIFRVPTRRYERTTIGWALRTTDDHWCSRIGSLSKRTAGSHGHYPNVASHYHSAAKWRPTLIWCGRWHRDFARHRRPQYREQAMHRPQNMHRQCGVHTMTLTRYFFKTSKISYRVVVSETVHCCWLAAPRPSASTEPPC